MSENSNLNEASATNSENKMETDEKFFDFNSYSEFHDQLSKSVKDTIQSSNQLFSNLDFDYYLSYPSFVKILKSQNERLLKLMGTVLKHQGVKKVNQLSNLEDDEKTDLVIDSNDQIIERLGIQLDEIEGLRKKTETEIKLTNVFPTTRNISTSWNRNTGMVSAKTTITNSKKTIEKPQQYFKDKIDNSLLPFLPKLRSKPNAMQPLSDVFSKLDNCEINEALFINNPELLENPYAYEIDKFVVSEEFLREFEPIKPAELDKTEYEYIDNVDRLIQLCEDLGKKNRAQIKEIAVDLEHHYYRSYLGFTCLMQISTRSKDYLIDTIKLRNEMYRLNDIFTDFTLLKVFHGADFDIEWLQKDFGIYVVNMFDTGQAARLLQFPHLSLSYLLQKYCQVQAQKQYQLADWRLRPLSAPMECYAREDTHYLLYIYDNLRNTLLKQPLLDTIKPSYENGRTQLEIVYDKCKQLCKKVYKKPVTFTKAYLNICKNSEYLNIKQMKALQSLYEWRDRIARESDESCEYVLKNHQLLKIAELLPREIHGILALCNPVSHIVETNLHQMHELIVAAREFKSESITSEQQLNESLNSSTHLITDSANTFTHLPTFDINNVLDCPHDFSHSINEAHDTNSSSTTTNNQHVGKIEDILIKPAQIGIELPSNMKISSDINKTIFGVDRTIEKFKRIKLANPFDKYMPYEYRTSLRYEIDDSEKWMLLRAVDNSKSSAANNLAASVAPIKVNDVEDTNVIPLKVQIRAEQQQQLLKPKKKVKYDWISAIEKHNNEKYRINALGASADATNEEGEIEMEGQQDDEQTMALQNNLSKIAASVRKQTPKKQQQQQQQQPPEQDIQPFKYDDKNISELFEKASKFTKRKQFDPNSKLSKHVKTGRVSKKQRPRHHKFNSNKSGTFKTQSNNTNK